MDKFLEELAHEFQTPFQDSVLIFSVILLIILLSPVLLNKIKIPSIIGLILSGVFVGPFGLNLIEKNSAVDLFSTIGLLYIMFIAGLELDIKQFNKNKYKSLIFGALTFILPLSIGLPVCIYLLGYGFNTSLLTASMFATHTLVTYPIVSRLGIAKNEAVAITVGGTILTDTAVLIILAVISGSENGGLTNEFWIRLGISIVIFLFIVAYLIPKLAEWFFRKLEGEKNSHFIFVLAMVFFSAFLAELAGLEAIIGAFAAGLSLNKLIPHTSSLMNRIEFVGNSLFIPFFLISVGMLIDLRVLVSGPTALIVAGTLTVVALSGKWIAAWLTALFMKYTKAQRNVIFGLSSAHAAATLAVILVGYNIGIIDENILNGTIVLILFTCLIASFITEPAGKKLALEEKNGDDTKDEPASPDQKILVPIANPETMDRLLDLAITLKKPKISFPIIGLAVVKDNEKAQAKILEANKMLEKAMIHAAAADQKVEIIATIDQNIVSGIKRVSTEIFATDIILGYTRKMNFTDLIFGKTLQRLINETHQTVFVNSLSLPLNVHKRVVVIAPPYSEKEPGFGYWLDRVLHVSSTLSVNCIFYSTQQTFDNVTEFAKRNKLNNSLQHKEFDDWNDFLILSRDLEKTDLVTIVLPRKGGISYQAVQSYVPQKMEKHFHDYSLLYIYPSILESSDFPSFASDYDPTLLEKGMITLSQGAKSLSGMFKSGNSNSKK